MLEKIDHHRRRFFGAAAMTVAAAQLSMFGSANAQAGKTRPTQLPAIKPGTNTSFGPLKQIDAGVLNIGYAEAGPADGPPVVLLHGWPYDIHSFVDVLHCWHRQATWWSLHIYVATERRDFCPATLLAMLSNQ